MKPSPTYPLFLRLDGKAVLVVGAGPVAASKLTALLAAGARITVVAPDAVADIVAHADAGRLTLVRRIVIDTDLDDAWLVVSAAPPEINRAVQAAGQARRVFVMAVDDVAATDAFAPAVLHRGGVRVALSSEGRAPALVGLLREALEAALPDDETLDAWIATATAARAEWKAQGLPLDARRTALLSLLTGARA